MTPAQPIFHALGLLVETVQREEDALWSHRCSAPVEAPGHELEVEGGQGCWTERTLVVGTDDEVGLGICGSWQKRCLNCESLRCINPWELRYV